MKKIALLTHCLTTFLLAGCISIPLGKQVGELNSVYEGQQIIIYRIPDNASLYFDGILDDIKTKDYVKRGGVSIIQVTPGNHTFTVKIPALFPSSSMSVNSLTVNLKPRDRKFIRVRTAKGGTERLWPASGVVVGRYAYIVEEVSPKIGEYEIRDLKFVN